MQIQKASFINMGFPLHLFLIVTLLNINLCFPLEHIQQISQEACYTDIPQGSSVFSTGPNSAFKSYRKLGVAQVQLQTTSCNAWSPKPIPHGINQDSEHLGSYLETRGNWRNGVAYSQSESNLPTAERPQGK